MTTVSGSLDEEDSDDITKGFTIEIDDDNTAMSICLTLTDGFDTTFRHRVVLDRTVPSIRNYYKLGGLCDPRDSFVAFVLDGGPKVSTG